MIRNRSVWIFFVSVFSIHSAIAIGEDAKFFAGAAAVDVTPIDISPAKPAIIAGGFLEAQSSQIVDHLYVRSIVLHDGKSKIVLTVVDTCMMTQSLIDEAKRIASKETGIPIDRMMVSATHTHSAPAAMACLGTRQDKSYAAWLPGKIAESIVQANKNLQVARIGWSSVDDWEHTHNRRWIRKPENKVVDPFGVANGLAHMHPGYLSPDVIGPSGPVDPALSVISLQTREGKPLAVFANYSQHYFGSGAVSSDYYGLFCKYVTAIVQEPGEGNGPFVCAISQGTSGDLMWMDYGSPAKPELTLDRYAQAVARYAEKALAKVEYRDYVTLEMVEKQIELKYRVPDESRLAWANPIAAGIQDEKPKSLPEVYAMEALILHERQKTNLKLQAIRIGDLTIATLPNEVYALTGLKLRGRSPATSHFNVELANGAEGYIPPPEQHVLGGYTTWPARTAGLEVTAETKIVDTLVEGLEKVTNKKPRAMTDEHGKYADEILKSNPWGYWRMNDEDGKTLRNAVSAGVPAKLNDGFAFYLPGVGSGTGIGNGEELVTGNFSGPNQINRAIHLAGGKIMIDAKKLNKTPGMSIAMWVWLGEGSGASERMGTVCQSPFGDSLTAIQSSDHRVAWSLNGQSTEPNWRADDWNFLVLVSDGKSCKLFVNGEKGSAIETKTLNRSGGDAFELGEKLQGKIDELAIFPKTLQAEDVQRLWLLSGIAEDRARQQKERAQAVKQLQTPRFGIEYAELLGKLKPLVHTGLEQKNELSKWSLDSKNVTFDIGSHATFRSGRITGQSSALTNDYSVSLWFRNELPNEARPVTAYLFSRGVDGDAKAPGDHLGIGGTFKPELTGHLIVFNGNDRDQVIVGRSLINPGTWNHALMVREKNRVRVYLNGDSEPDIDSDLDVTFADSKQFYLGARSDNFAPLQGNMANVAIYPRNLNPQEVQSLVKAAGEIKSRWVPEEDAKESLSVKPTSEALSPEESLKKIHVPLGYRVELMAAEPNVIDPVAMDWDARGRLWVVEMSDYPMGMDGQGKAGGKIRVLEDLDGDGRYEKSQLFAENIGFPNGILTWRDGVLVTAAPQLLFLRDTNGDGKADETEVLFEGFNEGNQQLRMNGLRWGLDGWVYCANGGHHAGHGLGTKVFSKRNGKTYEIGSRDFRIRPDTGELELESGPSQFGRNRDTWGHWFGVQNANPMWHYVLSDRYLGRNPYVPTITPIQHVIPSGSPQVYPASPQEKRYHSFEQSGRFTSACGSIAYGDQLLFGKIDSQRNLGANILAGHSFSCEPFHNVVQHNLMLEDGVSYVAARAANEGTYDFFASEDRWCRPVMVRTGPDGGLWVADMYRYMIEHPDWLPPEGKSELLPHYRLGDDRGRIYRVVPSMQKVTPIQNLEKLSSVELIKAFDTSNDFVRDKIHQIILWRNDKKTVPGLRQIWKTGAFPAARMQALYVLLELKELDETTISEALADAHPRIRENAIRMVEQMPSKKLIEAACALANDADAKVALQLALSIGEWDTDKGADALVTLAGRFGEQPMMNSAIMSSALRHEQGFISGFIKQSGNGLSAFREPLLRQSIGRDDRKTIAKLLESAMASPEANRWSEVDAFLLAAQSVGVDLHAMTAQETEPTLKPVVGKLDALLASAEQVAGDDKQSDTVRLGAAKLMLRLNESRDRGVNLLGQWLRPQVDPQLQSQVIASMAQSGSDKVVAILGEAWNELSPDLRGNAIDAWLSREAWTMDLLARVEEKKVAIGSLSLTQRARLLQHPKEAIVQKAKALMEQTGTATRKEIVDRYRKSLELIGEVERGKAVYAKSCANCHRRGSDGHDVGPNLATVIGHSPEKLLTNILDPNIDIQPGYQAYICVLDNGEILSGLLSSETANSITIKQANGTLRSIARREIETLKNTNLSFMPEGLETMISVEELADLIAFLRKP